MDAGDREPIAPAHLWVPPNRVGSMVEQATRLCDALGQPLDAEQQIAVDAITSIKADGTPAVLEGAVICPRQNLKTFILERIVLTKLLEPLADGERRLIIWSAHLFETAQETFRNFDELFATHDFLGRRVLKVHRGNGEEEIELQGGRRLKFRARSKSGGRGLSGDTVVLDEAFALQAGHMGALLPTLSTRRRAHVLYGSSAGLVDSAVLRSIRDRGRTGGPGAPAYVEWCAPATPCTDDACKHVTGTTGCALDREDLWQLSNPAMGRRITVDYLRSERAALPAAEFARERLGWWDEAGADAPVSLAAWAALADAESTFVGEPMVGFAIGPGLRSASVAAAGVREDGRTHVELIQHEAGTDWLPDYLAGVVERRGLFRVYAPATAFVATIVPALRDAGVEVELLPPRAMAAGCEQIAAEVEGDRLRHLGDPLITAALAGAARKDVGDGAWMWSYRKSDVDISPVEALTAARRGLAEAGEPMGPMVMRL